MPSVIPRALIRVGGPPGVGKTAFVEALLRSDGELLSIAVRCTRDPSLREAEECRDRTDAELARYWESGAQAVRYAFPVPDAEAFFTADFMQEWSEVVVLEGDDPIGFCDLAVHVATPSRHRLLLRRRSRPAPPPPISALVDLREQGPPQRRLLAQLEADASIPGRRPKPRSGGSAAAPVARWSIATEHAGIERAQLVIVNVRTGGREAGEALLAEVARMRADPEVFADLRARGVTRSRVTAVVADLADPRDPGTRKALSRVRRAIRSLT